MIGRALGHYLILEKIGAGGMGEVYLARDERLQRDVAIKILPAGTLADETARERFRKEALALSRLNHCRFNAAAAYAQLGETERAFESLDAAFLQRSD